MEWIYGGVNTIARINSIPTTNSTTIISEKEYILEGMIIPMGDGNGRLQGKANIFGQMVGITDQSMKTDKAPSQ